MKNTHKIYLTKSFGLDLRDFSFENDKCEIFDTGEKNYAKAVEKANTFLNDYKNINLKKLHNFEFKAY